MRCCRPERRAYRLKLIYELYVFMVRMHPIHESGGIHDSDIQTINIILFIVWTSDS